ncbi:MAG: N-acetylglucosamine kinase [Flavobacteriaceae bacterium]|nr:N-acetylglucosamine kinase [Bacteroidia bacterium]NNL16468.1 N-acetylglucosamine kinase [Flavobacteriaceae bacterium]
MIAVIDSGSTKSDWIIVDRQGKQLFDKVRTKGLNPAILSERKLIKNIKKSETLVEQKNNITHIYFYGAGCGTEKPCLMLKNVLQEFFTNAKVEVNEDTLAAVYSTINNNEPAVVCIMGTGSNCSYYDGNKLHQKVKSLGYTLMDDASGNYYGKQLIRDYYFGHMPGKLRAAFGHEYNMDSDFIKYNLYKLPNPNAYLASFAKFMFLNKDSEYVTNLLKKGIRLLAKNMILQFKEELKTVPVHFAGSIAYFSQEEVKEVANELGFRVGNFVRRPIEGLVDYHVKNLS